MRAHRSEYIQNIAEQLRSIMESSGATYEQMQRALGHACNADGGLDPRAPTTTPLKVTWELEADIDLVTEEAVPALAAAHVWRTCFDRRDNEHGEGSNTQPDAEQECTFEVVAIASGKSTRINLCMPEYRDLFD